MALAAFILLYLLPASESNVLSDSGYIKVLSRAEGAVVSIDGQQVGVVPLADRVRVQAGCHTVQVGGVEKAITVAPGSTVVVDMDVPEIPPARASVAGRVVTGCIAGAAVVIVLLFFATLRAILTY